MVELPADPDVVLIIVHNANGYVVVPLPWSYMTGEDAAIAINDAIEKAKRDLQSNRRLYRGAPGERY
jgi:hypothetical protein